MSRFLLTNVGGLNSRTPLLAYSCVLTSRVVDWTGLDGGVVCDWMWNWYDPLCSYYMIMPF